MKSPFIPVVTLILTLCFRAQADQSTQPSAGEIATAASEWTKIQLTNEFWSESASVGDVNHDGHNDILSGPFWYAGPGFTVRTEIYSHPQSYAGVPGFAGLAAIVAANRNSATGDNNIDYSNNFDNYTMDVNNDGWVDYIAIGFHGTAAYWYENPKNQAGSFWVQHLLYDYTQSDIDKNGVGNESPMFVDVSGDGKPDLLCMSQGYIGYAQQDTSNLNNPWIFKKISKFSYHYMRFTHGIGYGDVDKDGLTDILVQGGWWKQPASWNGVSAWQRFPNDAPDDPSVHPGQQFGEGGAQMYVQDVNGDGLNDIITTLAAHYWDVAWFEQLPGNGWTRHLIIGHQGSDPAATNLIMSQMHGVDLVDMNNDGIKDLLLGKRLWAHGPNGGDSDDGYTNSPGGDAGMSSPASIYWIELQNAAALTAPGLINGTNVLSAEVHQFTAGSSDMVFGARFKLSTNGSTPLASADTDKDGQPDNFEALFGTSSTNPNSSYKITPTKNGSNQAVLTFPTISAKYYRVEYSDNPASGWKTAATILASSTSTSYTDTTSPIPTNRSYRVAFSPYCTEYGDTWKHFVPVSDPGTSWRNVGFNDASWGSGPGLLGFESGAVPAPGMQTLVGSQNQSNVYLFRKTFTFSGNPSGVTFSLDSIVDDGATFYLNGNLLGSLRHNPGGGWNNLASGTPPTGSADAIEEVDIFRGTGTPVFTPHLINHQSGVGVAVKGVDVNADGKTDVVVGNKHGAFVFLRK